MTATTTVVHVLEATGHGTARHLIDLIGATPSVVHHVVIPRARDRQGEPGHDRLGQEVRALGATVHRVEMWRFPLHPGNALAVLTVARLVRRLRPDVVHGHAGMGGAVARVAATLAATGAHRIYTPNGLLPSRLAMLLERVLAAMTDTLVAVSDSEATLLRTRSFRTRGQVVTIPNAIDPDRIPAPLSPSLRERLGLAPDRPLVGLLGRMAAQKAPDVFVGSMAIVLETLPDAFAVLIGGGPDVAAVERQIDDLGLRSSIHRIDGIWPADGALLEMDVLVQPSRWEGAPYVPLEAMRAGTALVLSDCVGNVDVVVDGVSGRIVPVDDPAALADAITDLLADPVARERMKVAATARLREEFTLERMGSSYAVLYAQAAAAKGA